MKTLLSITLTLIFALCAFGQTKDLPIIGSIEDIRPLSKFYLAADNTDSRKMILHALRKEKNLVVVNNPDEAEFILEYKVIAEEGVSGERRRYQQRSEMQAYFYKDGRKVVAWSDTETYDNASAMGLSAPNEENLVKNFLKELKRKKK